MLNFDTQLPTNGWRRAVHYSIVECQQLFRPRGPLYFRRLHVYGAGRGEADFGIGAQADVPAVAVYYDSLHPGGRSVVGDAEVESVSVPVAAGFGEEASESGSRKFCHESHIHAHKVNGLAGTMGGLGLSSRGRIRTCDLAVNSRPLYH